MMVYGALLRAIWEWYRGTGQSAGALIILLIAWHELLRLDSMFSDALAVLPRQVLIVLVVFWIVTRGKRSGEGARLQSGVHQTVWEYN
jgi:hypothetical protein